MTEAGGEQDKGQGIDRERKTHFTIEATPRLDLDQNLYDQAPFASLITRVTTQTGTQEEYVRSALSFFADTHFAKVVENPHYNELQLFRDMHAFKDNDPVHIKIFSKVSPAIRLGMLKALQDVPYWSEYISRQRERTRYKMDGIRNPKNFYRGEETPPSYAQWVTDKLQSRKHLSVHGIDEVFPVENPVTAHPNQTGVKPSTRKYRILRASEIMRRR